MSSNGGFIFHRPDDETLIVTLIRGGEEHDIAFANHDEHGWAGIVAVEKAVKEIAYIFGMPIRETS